MHIFFIDIEVNKHIFSIFLGIYQSWKHSNGTCLHFILKHCILFKWNEIDKWLKT